MSLLKELENIDKNIDSKINEENRLLYMKMQEEASRAEVKEKEDRLRVKLQKEQEGIRIIEKILNDPTQGLDEPHVYNLKYTHTVYYYGRNPLERVQNSSVNVIMTEREKRIQEFIGFFNGFYEGKSVGYDENITDVVGYSLSKLEPIGRNKLEIDRIKQKIDTIKQSSESKENCTLVVKDFIRKYHNGYYPESLEYRVQTTLGKALSVNVVNESIDKNITNGMEILMPQKEQEKEEEQKRKEEKEQKLSRTKQVKKKGKITLNSICDAIWKSFGGRV